MIPLAKAQKIAARVAEELAPFCSRVEIAGSIRRQQPEVGDVDLVLQVTDQPGLERRVTARCKLEKSGSQYLVARMADGTQLDLWFAHAPRPAAQLEMLGEPEARPANFGSLLLCRTGSTQHNMMLCEVAKLKGLHWNPHWGVFRAGACVASTSEEEIYAAMGLGWIAPEEREFASRMEQLRVIHQGRIM